MSGIIIFIIFVYIVVSFSTVRKKQRPGTEPNKPRTDRQHPLDEARALFSGKSSTADRRGNHSTTSTASHRTKSSAGNTYSAGGSDSAGGAYSADSPSLSDATGSVDGTTSSVKKTDPTTLIEQGAILARANEEVNKQHTEDHERVLMDQMRAVGSKEDFKPETKPETAQDRRKKLQDLMIKGYDGNLVFQRDFVAEGVEMLNRYTDI